MPVKVQVIGVRRSKRDEQTRWPLEIGSMGAAAALWAGGEYVRLRRAPAPGLEREAQRALNRLDRAARTLLLQSKAAGFADLVSDALGYGAAPLTCLLALWRVDGLGRWLARDALRVLRAVAVTGALNQVIKFAAPRERPFAAATSEALGKDRYGSFFSNHTSAMAAMASATARLAARRDASGWVVAPLFALALFVGYLRVAADQHYLTDVLAGAAFGTGVGVVFTF